MEAPTGMIQRWLDMLANHQFVVKHRAGIKHGNADALSRAPHLTHLGNTDVSKGENIASLNLSLCDDSAENYNNAPVSQFGQMDFADRLASLAV
jgi:hypothetical protein